MGSLLERVVVLFVAIAWTASPLAHAQLNQPIWASTGPQYQEVFQVSPPVLARSGADDGTAMVQSSSGGYGGGCVQVLMEHSFAFSYGHPFIGQYNPPSCQYNQVVLTLAVVSQGRQFDRLGSAYLGDVEIWRTSTAEPTENGIQWTYDKDVSNYLSLFKTAQKVIFDLGNLINDQYTAPFNTTLTAHFINNGQASSAADLIVPISARHAASNGSSWFTLPSDQAVNQISFPRNMKRAVVSIAATGQAAEEFWYTNVLSSDTHAFSPNDTLPGSSPFREVQLLIDDGLAGVVWPSPVIFTGGINPQLWRPVVGIEAFDLREAEIDITPWLPLLCDGNGNGHRIEIRVVGIDDDGRGHGTLSKTIANNWVVTGKVFVWLDTPGSITTGTAVQHHAPDPRLRLSSSMTRTDGHDSGTLRYQVQAHRHLRHRATIKTSSGEQTASWRQTLDFTTTGHVAAGGAPQLVQQHTRGVDLSSSGYLARYQSQTLVDSNTGPDASSGDAITVSGRVNRALSLQTYGPALFPTHVAPAFGAERAFGGVFPSFRGAALSTVQDGRFRYSTALDGQIQASDVSTEQQLTLGGLRTAPDLSNAAATANTSTLDPSFDLYRRHVLAANGALARDDEWFVGHRPRSWTAPATHDPGSWDPSQQQQQQQQLHVRHVLGRRSFESAGRSRAFADAVHRQQQQRRKRAVGRRL
ncbi:MAG: hypothetical protein M1826_002785 [Phylliscum demangeonii]|nr:MAG: hypothetical protein M1826_002785 [Phylliscum demangeonii]